MTLSEVEILMQELGRHVRDHTQTLFGTAVDGRMGNRLSVTIISSLAEEDEGRPLKPIRVKPEPAPDSHASSRFGKAGEQPAGLAPTEPVRGRCRSNTAPNDSTGALRNRYRTTSQLDQA